MAEIPGTAARLQMGAKRNGVNWAESGQSEIIGLS
jgi:hypothetical protein